MRVAIIEDYTDESMDKCKEIDIPISSTLASGMVPLLTYAVRLLPK